jgi:hypothetical protein
MVIKLVGTRADDVIGTRICNSPRTNSDTEGVAQAVPDDAARVDVGAGEQGVSGQPETRGRYDEMAASR